MIRRQFLKLATLTGAGSLASAVASDASLDAIEGKQQPNLFSDKNTNNVTWHVRGFSCVTCAMGLQVMLRQQKGVAFADASYPDGIVTIQFHPDEVDEASLRSFISSIGFTAEEQKG